jgi:hypothetical protein
MVVYVFHLGNQRQLNGGDIGAATGRNWPTAACCGAIGGDGPHRSLGDIAKRQLPGSS